MGRGVNAGVVIDKEPSPRRAAIEKAQAELRKLLSVKIGEGSWNFWRRVAIP